eukprot:9877389-Alexandrium_andersonii.AAC.1
MHILHTIRGNLTGALETWKALKVQLEGVMVVMNSDLARSLFISSCLLPVEGGKPYEAQFENFHQSIAEWRWGSVL